jgi:hypothetical protein
MITAARANGTPAASTFRQNPSNSTASLFPASPAAVTQSEMAVRAVAVTADPAKKNQA